MDDGKKRVGQAVSGPAIRPVALRMVWEAAQAVDIPVCAIGGISNAEHILEFVSVGASMVQVGTHLYREPTCLISILSELRELLAQEGYSSLESLRGSFGSAPDRLPESSRPVG